MFAQHRESDAWKNLALGLIAGVVVAFAMAYGIAAQ
jgi:hypothetical protein